MAGEFGDDSQRQQGREGIAAATTLAAIWDGLEVGGQGSEAEGKGHLGRQVERAGQYGSMHVTPSVGMSGWNTPIIRQLKVSLPMSRLCTSPGRGPDRRPPDSLESGGRTVGVRVEHIPPPIRWVGEITCRLQGLRLAYRPTGCPAL